MHFCRICRTDKNLKYTTKQLRQVFKRQRNDEQKRLINATPTSVGNICVDCEERLHNFHKLDGDDENSDIDVECDVISTPGQRKESPVIVDDDELLYNLFYKRIADQQHRKGKITDTKNDDRLKQVSELTQQPLCSDGNTEIIEVLTSRESTPAPQHKIVAVIDLDMDDVEEHVQVPIVAKLPPTPESDDEEIVFRTVEPDAVVFPRKPSPNKKCRKTFAEREMRLIASLSLLSSDSEMDDEVVYKQPQSTSSSQLASPSRQTHQCKHCDVRLPDAESLQVHARIHTGVICPICQLGFPASQRLVQHMRRKHRSYEGHTLSERPRCPQDSAMTIRLRYLERYTYFECQLCGRIDVTFKEHKEHVMQQHAAESKSLKDPMMKELKCPVCKEKCINREYVMLCRHLLSAHSAVEYTPHLKEVTQSLKFNWKCQKSEIERTARVFKFAKRRSCFFECKLCRKVVVGFPNHLQHLNVHNRTKESDKQPSVTAVLAEKVLKTNEDLKKQSNASNKNNKQKIKQNGKMQTVLPLGKLKKISKGTSASKQQPLPVSPKKQRICRTKKVTQAAGAGSSKNKIKNKTQNKILNKAQLKVKPPLRKFPTLKYNCKFCSIDFKGFHRLNLHQLAVHGKFEYKQCYACSRSFTSNTTLVQHELLHKTHALFLPQKRKRNALTNELKVDENCNTDCNSVRHNGLNVKAHVQLSLQDSDANSASKDDGNTWLQDLLQLSQQQNASSSMTNTYTATTANHQCCFCTHLFATADALNAHEAKQHVSNNHLKSHLPAIKRYAVKPH